MSDPDSTAARRLRIVWAEDSAEDAELLSTGLEAAGVAHEYLRVEDGAALREALAGFEPDLVLADLSIPGFSGKRALQVVRELRPSLPFLFVSGTMGEDAAVEALRDGANDYILKQNPVRLASAVERAVREAQLIAERERTAAELARAQRLGSLARLVTDLGHEIRNLLQPLAFAPTLLQRSPDATIRQLAEIIDDCVQRGDHMVESMLAFVDPAHAVQDPPSSNAAVSVDILLVDHDSTQRALEANALEAQGYRVIATEDGVAALATLPVLPPVIVLDAGSREEVLSVLRERGFDAALVLLYDGAFPLLAPGAFTPYFLARPVPMTRLVRTVGRLVPVAA